MEEESLFAFSNNKGLYLSIFAIIVVFMLFFTFYTVNSGERAVILTFGKVNDEVVSDGLHAKIPLIQTIKKFDIKTLKEEVLASSASKDLQTVHTTIALNYHLSPEQVPSLYREVGKEYKQRIIDPAIQEEVKATTAKFTAEELVTHRAEVRAIMQEALRERLSKYYIIVDDLNIVDFKFSEEFDKAIEQKVTAEQLKLKAANDLERVNLEVQAIKLQNTQLTPAYLEFKQLELQSKALDKWDGRLPQVTGGQTPLIGLNLN